jgi:hypothetical protein
MAGEAPLPPHVHELEYWKRYRTLRSMTGRIASQQALIRALQDEGSVPQQIKDLAVKAMSSDIDETRRMLIEVLENFISVGLQSAHVVDIEVSVVIPPDSDLIDVDACLLLIDGREEPIPPEIGEALVTYGIRHGHGAPVRALLEFYRNEEVRYDRVLEGALGRCSIRILQELYPGKNYRIRLRLPAQALIEYGVVS